MPCFELNRCKMKQNANFNFSPTFDPPIETIHSRLSLQCKLPQLFLSQYTRKRGQPNSEAVVGRGYRGKEGISISYRKTQAKFNGVSFLASFPLPPLRIQELKKNEFPFDFKWPHFTQIYAPRMLADREGSPLTLLPAEF